MTEFKKYDQGKAPLAHLRYVPQTMEDISRVLHYGADVKGYGRVNWADCDNLDRYFSAADRHITAFYNGELLDKESGFSHLAHAISNLIFINEITHRNGTFKDVEKN